MEKQAQFLELHYRLEARGGQFREKSMFLVSILLCSSIAPLGRVPRGLSYSSGQQSSHYSCAGRVLVDFKEADMFMIPSKAHLMCGWESASLCWVSVVP